MPRGFEPIIVPGPAGDEFSRSQQRMKALQLERAERNPRLQFTELTRPGSQERRELESSIEKYQREIEKYAGSLKQNQNEWRRGTGEIIQDILKLADSAAELYEPYQEYPLNDNFKDYGEDKERAAIRRDYRLNFLNQAIALYYRNVIQDLEKAKITDKPEFEEALHFLNTLKAKMSERAALDRAAMEFETQAGLAQSYIALSQERTRESAAHSREIQALPDRIGSEKKYYLHRLLRAGHVKAYSEQAEQQVKELEGVLAHVEKHRRETEAKIEMYKSQAQKRAAATDKSRARIDAINSTLTLSRTRATEAGLRTANATDRVTAKPIGNTDIKDYLETIRTMNKNDSNAIIDKLNSMIEAIRTEVIEYETRAEEARTRAEEARTRAEEARTRAEEARTRSRIAKANNDPTISEEAAQDVEKHARAIENLEKQVVENASLIESNHINTQHMLMRISNRLKLVRNIVDKVMVPEEGEGTFKEEDINNLQKFANDAVEAEIAMSSAIAFEEQATKKEETVLKNIRDELPEELAALTKEHVTETAIATKANLDLPHLQNLVNRQKALEEVLRGGTTEHVLTTQGLIERERNYARTLNNVERAIGSGSPREGDVVE